MADIGIACLGAVATKVTEWLLVPVGRGISFAFNHDKNNVHLKEQLQELTDRRDRVQHSVEIARRQGDEIEKDVEKWLTRVDALLEHVKASVIDVNEDEETKKSCFKCLCPNPVTRYFLNRKAVIAAKDCLSHQEQGEFDRVSYRPVICRMDSMLIRGYEDFNSRKQIFLDIMGILKEDKFSMIGVHGMGGVGKTTLAKKVAWHAMEEKLFDVLIMAEVTQNPDVKAIQGKIADQLDLKFQEESESGRAARLRNRLKKEKKVLVILDNIWAKIDLEAIGIPFRADKKGNVIHDERRNDSKGPCRILLTSRNLDVLRNVMNTQSDLSIQILSDNEAENLFWMIVGNSVGKTDFQPIAAEIVGKCAGLPVAIVTVANALKNKNIHVWKAALDQLIHSDPKHIDGMHATVYSAIELSYNFLESKEAKFIFLLCALQDAGNSVSMDFLLTCVMGLGLFQDVYKLGNVRNRLYAIVDSLKASCLLLEAACLRHDRNDLIKMHDIVHAVAKSIASTNEFMFNTRSVDRLKEELEENRFQNATIISLPWTDIPELPQRLECRKLKMLLLISTVFTSQLHDLYFERLEELRILHLGKFLFQSLPSSLCCLANLRTLYFLNCSLGDIAIIGELRKLEILRFRNSEIERLPGKIGQLTRLKWLELYNCPKLKVISPNVISSLIRLEELQIVNSFVEWDVEGNATLAELKQLSHLESLDVQVLDDRLMPKDILFEKLERYKILIGDAWDWYGKFEASRTLKLKLNNSFYPGHWIEVLLKKAEDLYLDELTCVNNFLFVPDYNDFQQLKHLHVQNVAKILYIVNSRESVPYVAFPKLESLCLCNLLNLEKVCHGKLMTESFNKLKIVRVEKCDSLNYLFSFSMAKSLSQLQEIEVTDCQNLKEVIGDETEGRTWEKEASGKIEFTHLHSLRLEHLPQLTSFGYNVTTPFISNSSSIAIMGSQEIKTEGGPNNFLPLFGQKVVLSILKNLELYSIGIECRWLDQLQSLSSCCPTLTRLTLNGCDGLKFLFSYSAVKSLVQLQKLQIVNCKSVEGIISTEEVGGDKKNVEMIFPALSMLQLKGLPRLRNFGAGNSVEFPTLIALKIEDCPNLETFFSDIIESKGPAEENLNNCGADVYPFFDQKVTFSNLKELKLRKLPKLLHLWKRDTQPGNFFENLTNLHVSDCENLRILVPPSVSLRNLMTLQVWRCDGLTNLMTLSVARTLVQLEDMDIFDCEMIEEIIVDAGDEKIITMEGKKDAAIDHKITFRMLNSIMLDSLPKLTSFYSGSETLECPSLTTIGIKECPKMETFVFPYTKDICIPSASLFNEKVVLPTLKGLHLTSIGTQTIWHKQQQAVSCCFRTLTKLIMNGIGNLKYLFSASICQSLVQLELLQISNCKSIEEVIVIEEEMIGNSIELSCLSELVIENCTKLRTFASDSPYVATDIQAFFNEKVAFPCLEILELRDLPKLFHLWKENSHSSKVIENLTTLEVSDCRNLETLVSSTMSLQNLTMLKISKCDGLRNLVTFSTAKTLTQLTIMEIFHCKMMEEIIVEVGEEARNGIVFNQLKCLKLRCLPNLTSFCKENFIIEFPSLEQALVTECLKMKTFSEGVLSTPKLQKLQLTAKKDGDACWKGDFNTSIQQLFKEKNPLSLQDAKNLK